MNYDIDIDKRRTSAVWWRDVSCVLHVQRDMEIVYVAEGRLNMRIGEAHYIVEAGQIIFVEPYELHSFSAEMSNLSCVIEFRPELVPEMFSVLKMHTPQSRICTPDRCVLQYLDYLLPDRTRIENDIHHAGQMEESYIRCIADVLCHEFLTRCTFLPVEKKYDDLYIGALHIISRDIDQHLSLSYVARQLGICPETLCRKFAEQTHMTFVEYVQYVRVLRAAEFLREGRSIADAAMCAGFGSLSSFNRTFKKITGKTPSAYRLHFGLFT